MKFKDAYEQSRDAVYGYLVYFNEARYTLCRVNYSERYLVTEQGTSYYISAEFAEAVRAYAEEGILPGAENGGIVK